VPELKLNNASWRAAYDASRSALSDRNQGGRSKICLLCELGVPFFISFTLVETLCAIVILSLYQSTLGEDLNSSENRLSFFDIEKLKFLIRLLVKIAYFQAFAF